MRNYIKIVLVISMISSCAKDNVKSKNVAKFKEIIGRTELEELNVIIKDLDKELEANYPEDRHRFKRFLKEFNEPNFVNQWSLDSLKLRSFLKSKLFNTYKMAYPDSVWFNGKTFSVEYKELAVSEEVIPILKVGEYPNVDSTVAALLNQPSRILVARGKFFIALDSIRLADTLVSNYLDAKEAAGRLSPYAMTKGLEYSINKDNEYFAKRIFVMEIFQEF